MTQDQTNAERQARYRAKRDALIVKLEQEVARLRDELALRNGKRTRPQPPPMPDNLADFEKKKGKRKAKAAVEPKPPRQAGEEIESLKRQLKAARTQNANLKQKVHWLTASADDRVRLVMPKRLYREIIFHVHPDRIQDAKLRKRANKCLAEFSALKVEFIDE
jgi:hypothetical protein